MVVVAGIGFGTPCVFKRITDTVLVRVYEALTVAVVATFGIDAVAVSCVCIVVACCFIEASFNFKFVAYSVAIGIGDAVSFAIITCIREDTAYEVGDEVWIDVVARFCACLLYTSDAADE